MAVRFVAFFLGGPLLALCQTATIFTGANYPYVFYGDFGCNAWGCRGTSTEGFVAETYPGSDGARSVLRTKSGPSGNPALHYDCSLNSEKSCEVYVDLAYVRPEACPQPLNPPAPINLNGATIRVRVCFPSDFPGPSFAPTGLQIFVKGSSGSPNWYSNWTNLTVGGCQEFAVPVEAAFGVGLLGIKLGGNAANPNPISGRVYLERLSIETSRPITFDFRQSTVERDFAAIGALATASGKLPAVARVFLFVDGRAGIAWAADGAVAGFDTQQVFRDFDALLEGAAATRVKLIPVLLDFLLLDRAQIISGVQTGGHSDVIRDSDKRKTLFDLVFKPFLQRYGNHPSIVTWEVMNEPEWPLTGVPGHTPGPEVDPVSLNQMQDFVRAAAAFIRQYSTLPVSIGSTRRSWLYLWKNLGLDAYSFHYYDYDTEPFPWGSAASLGLDGPVSVGEVPTASTAHSFAGYLTAASQGGYHGCLAWSCRGEDGFSEIATAIQSAAAVNQTPSPVSGTPDAGSGADQSFTFTFSDPNGWQDLGVVNILYNFFLDGRQACYLAYARQNNTLYLVNDTGTALLPGLTVNGTGSVANSQCAVRGATVSGSGTAMTLTLNMTFYSAFGGTRAVYMAARDLAENNSGWQRMGVWTVPGASQTTTTSVVGMEPARGAGASGKFSVTFADTKGWQDLGVVNVLVNDWLDGSHACYLAYARPTNTLYLVNDAGSALLGPMPMTGSGTLSNSQCTVNGAGSSATGSGNTLTLTLDIAFGAGFTGNRLFYLAARDAAESNNTGWRASGSWQVQ
jgi:hypothetical protein